MKFNLLAAAVVAFAGAAHAQTLTTEKDKTSYAVGMHFGGMVAQNIPDVKNETNVALLMKGFEAALTGAKTQLTDAEKQTLLTAFGTKLQEKQTAKAKADMEKNAAEGTKFLTENKKKAGVKTTASGLQYQVITMGKGAIPKETNTVKVHYSGKLLNGTEFDSSYKRNQPAEFPLNGVIKGWTEGLQLMPAGSKFKFFIPEGLAYGENAPPNIGPKQTLVFEVELLEVK